MHILCLDPSDPAVSAKCDEIDAFLAEQGLETLYDDRDERPGVKFKDADLLGIPAQVTVGGKGLGKGIVEVKDRRTGEKAALSAEGFRHEFAAWYDGVLEGWKNQAERQ